MPDSVTIGERIEELRKDKGWSQQQLAERIFASKSQISRIESGETKNVSSEMIIAFAKVFNVSTDYLLGLSKLRSPKNYDISQLGLSEEVVRKLLLKKIDVDILNRLLEHERFSYLCLLIRNYFDYTVANGIMGRNEIIDLAIEPLSKLKIADPQKRSEMVKDLNFLKSQKIGKNEADIEKIKSVFLTILKDIKSGIETKESTGAIATSEAVKRIMSMLPDKENREITADDVSSATAAYLETVLPMDERNSEIMESLIKSILEGNEDSGKE